MLHPSIDSLMEIVDSKYTLVTVAAKRARYLNSNANNSKIAKPVSHKKVGLALEEIHAGFITVERPADDKDE